MKPIRAEMSRSYLIRLGLVAFFSIGLSLFCLYDGWVRYPRQRERAIAYRQIYDAALETISPRAVSASRSLAASRPPAQWSEKQWSDRVNRAFKAQADATTSTQSTVFLQLAWLYQQLAPGNTNAIDESTAVALRGKLRNQLLKMTERADDFVDDPDSPIHTVAREAAGNWSTRASDEGWSQSYPGVPKNQYQIQQQFVMAAGIFPFGFYFLYVVLRNCRRFVEADGKGLRASWGPSVSFSQIDTFDKKRWDKKGIAKIRYTQEGKRKTFVLDDCNYNYQPIRAMVRLVESKIDRKQIVGGEPEPPEKPQKKDG